MLFPPVISVRETLTIMDIISYAARNPGILEISKDSTPSEIDLSNFINSILYNSSIYQYSLSKVPNCKVVLDNELYEKIRNYASQNMGFSGYMFGEEKDGVIHFKYDSIHADNDDIGSADSLLSEMNEIIRYTDYNCVAHIHTHSPEDNYSLFPSNKELYVYAYLQENYKVGDRDLLFLGGLVTPLVDDNGEYKYNDLCFIFYDRNVKKFYKCDNIYYQDENGEVKPLNKITYRYTDKEDGKVLLKERRVLLQKDITNPNIVNI